MTTNPDPVCFTCGQAYDGQNFNRMRNGAVCPTCRDRLLDSLPAPLPKARQEDQVEALAGNSRATGILRALPPEPAPEG